MQSTMCHRTWKQPHHPRRLRMGGILIAGTSTLTRERPRRSREPIKDQSTRGGRGTRRRQLALKSANDKSGRDRRFR